MREGGRICGTLRYILEVIVNNICHSSTLCTTFNWNNILLVTTTFSVFTVGIDTIQSNSEMSPLTGTILIEPCWVGGCKLQGSVHPDKTKTLQVVHAAVFSVYM